MGSQVLVSAVSLILVVGVAIGVVCVVNRTSDKPGDDGQLNTHTKAVQAVCQGSDDKKFCVDTLSPVNTSDPNDYIKAVVKTSMESVIKAFNMSDTLAVENDKDNATVKMALDDCKDLLQSAIQELAASDVLIHDNNAQNVTTRTAELKNWLGAVVAYQQSCLDGFNTDGEKQVQSQLQTGSLDDVGKLTALALDVVSAVAKVLSAFNLDLDVKSASRRLFEADQDEEGNPEWMSAADLASLLLRIISWQRQWHLRTQQEQPNIKQ
ncbi:hypothetical protein TSUD_35960 [Trifolium subterraneum]|uniref:Pectinesterase inhibitor domain-containing protein n=1 Tax=Trifolium subterraneum TaxID=3900 RepID=A0A2Z6P979_TRISU|nr:hypothetical protein TSUD_35960 [Trifolium subterraneum]